MALVGLRFKLPDHKTLAKRAQTFFFKYTRHVLTGNDAYLYLAYPVVKIFSLKKFRKECNFLKVFFNFVLKKKK